MSVITLRSQNVTTEIDLHGALVRTLRVGDADIIFPAQIIGEKLRGGVPVCAPVFGPGESVGLKQHGFARDIDWKVLSQTDQEVKLTPINLTTQAANLPESYHGCLMVLTVQLGAGWLSLQLDITNTGQQAFVCSPGFHPYFKTADATSVVIKTGVDKKFDEAQLLATQFLPQGQPEVRVLLDSFVVTLASDTLQQYAIWSANPSKYVCVEPTYGGYLEHQAELPKLLAGESKTYGMTITWERLA